MKVLFRIPEPHRPICFTPIDIPGEWPKTSREEGLAEMVILHRLSN